MLFNQPPTKLTPGLFKDRFELSTQEFSVQRSTTELFKYYNLV